MKESDARAFRFSIVGGLLAALIALSWLPFPLHSRSVAQKAPDTVERDVALSLTRLVAGSPRGFVAATASGGVRFLEPVRTRPTSICPGIHFTAFALTWTQHGAGTVSATVRSGSGAHRMGDQQLVGGEEAGPDPGTLEDHPTLKGTNLIWAGNATCAEIAMNFPRGPEISNVRADFVNTLGSASGGRPILGLVAAAGPPRGFGMFGATPAEAWTNRPSIITRAQWGANERFRNCGPDYSNGVKVAFVHHTANANSYTRGQSAGIVRAIYWYHTKVLKWCDIAYNFLVDRYGQIFEGRFGGMDQPVIPGATRGFNTNSTAVAAIGNFQLIHPPAPLLASLKRILA